MKLTAYTTLALTALAFSLSACDGDDEPTTAFSREQLLGTWNLERQEVVATSEISGMTTPYTESIDESEVELTFEEDGTFYRTGTSRYTLVVHPGTDSATTETERLDDVVFPGTYTVEGTTVTTTEQFYEADPNSPVVTVYEVRAFVPGQRLVLDGTADNRHIFLGADLRVYGTVELVLTR